MATASAAPAMIADLHDQLLAANERIEELEEMNELLTEELDSLRQHEEEMESGDESSFPERDSSAFNSTRVEAEAANTFIKNDTINHTFQGLPQILPVTINAYYLGGRITKVEAKLDKVTDQVGQIEMHVTQLYMLEGSKRVMSKEILRKPCRQ